MDERSTRRGTTVVLVGVDPAVRRVVRLGLELDGAVVVEGDSIDEARDRALSGRHEVRGVVFDGERTEEVLELVRRSWPEAQVVVLDDSMGLVDPTVLVRRLALPPPPRPPAALSAAAVLHEEADRLAGDWAELCRWDPMLPPECEPPHGPRLVRAVADAMARPQPLGWGADPAVEEATEAFAAEVGALEVAIGQLVCLREALRRRIVRSVPADEREETLARLSMVVDRAIGVAAGRSARQLEQDAYVDPLTGLLNRRALDRDVRREIGRAARYGVYVSVMVVDVDGLKLVNDSEGHLAGDQHLVSLAGAFTEVLRSVDAAYRVGGDEFVLMLPDAGPDAAEVVAARTLAVGAPSFSWGVATFPADGESVDALLDLADRRLFTQRRRVRQG
jgi:diguanylate cyclase (GGDEF)-like protein